MLLYLPEEIVVRLAFFLDASSLTQLGRTCESMRLLAIDEGFR
jgi:hypothetical protein